MVTSVELCRFKWVHLSERLAYEQAVKQQRMRTEISQVHTTHTLVHAHTYIYTHTHTITHIHTDAHTYPRTHILPCTHLRRCKTRQNFSPRHAELRVNDTRLLVSPSGIRADRSSTGERAAETPGGGGIDCCHLFPLLPSHMKFTYASAAAIPPGPRNGNLPQRLRSGLGGLRSRA